MLSLKELRVKNGDLSQEEVAKKLGVARVTYGLWERNILSISTKNLIKLATLFNVSIDDLLGHKVIAK